MAYINKVVHGLSISAKMCDSSRSSATNNHASCGAERIIFLLLSAVVDMGQSGSRSGQIQVIQIQNFVIQPDLTCQYPAWIRIRSDNKILDPVHL